MGFCKRILYIKKVTVFLIYIIILYNCSHTGRTFFSVATVINSSGFSNNVGTFSTPVTHSVVQNLAVGQSYSQILTGLSQSPAQ